MDRTDIVNVPESEYFTVVGRDGEESEIFGKLLGTASSRSESHNGHVEVDSETGKPVYVQPGQRCSRCRWFDVSIYRVERFFGAECTCSDGSNTEDDGNHDADCGEQKLPKELGEPCKFLVVTYGPTIVPGELVKRSLKWTPFPFTLVEFLIQNGVRGRFLPATSARALSVAAHRDHELCTAFTVLFGNSLNKPL